MQNNPSISLIPPLCPLWVFSAVSWRKDGIPFRSSTTRPIKAEGERHTLLVRSARMTDAGLYTVCATNEVAETCCSAILTVRPGKDKEGGRCQSSQTALEAAARTVP